MVGVPRSLEFARHYNFAAAYLVLLVPTTTVNVIYPETIGGIPSNMCPVSRFLALIVALYVLPRGQTQNTSARGCCCYVVRSDDYQLRWRSPPKSRRGLSSRGRASLTVMVRPSSSELLSFSIAASASASFSYSTKPNPRERPLSRSVTTFGAGNSTTGSKVCTGLSSVVAQARLPTKVFHVYFSLRLLLQSTYRTGKPIRFLKLASFKHILEKKASGYD